jgi:hypothetical protein
MCICAFVFKLNVCLSVRPPIWAGPDWINFFFKTDVCLSVRPPIWAGPDWIRLFVLDNVQCFVYSRSNLVQADVYAAQPGLDWHGSTPGFAKR